MPFTEDEQALLDSKYAPIESLNVQWLLFNGVLVFLMQCGFAMLCAGSVRAKNAKNILLKNLVDVCVGALAFWATGYGLSARGNQFLGTRHFFLSDGFSGTDGYHTWFFQFAFAATATTIVSGAVAERCHMRAYAGYSAVLTGLVYPAVAHWVWDKDGWLSTRRQRLSAQRGSPLLRVGVVDFAGSGVVHMVGGAAAFIGARVLGPRIGRFGVGEVYGVERAMLEALAKHTPIRGHSMPLVVLGTFLLWVGFYGFNAGSTLGLEGDDSATAARVVATTTLAAAAGGLVSLWTAYARLGHYDVAEMCNGILAGLVSITGGCAVVEPWAAVATGCVGALVYAAGASALEYSNVDDAVNAAPVHYCAGLWGLVAPGIFARPHYVREVYDTSEGGLVYGSGGRILACNLIAAIAITGWVAAIMYPFFSVFAALGWLRVPMDEEIDGLDGAEHGGTAYAFDGAAETERAPEIAAASTKEDEMSELSFPVPSTAVSTTSVPGPRQVSNLPDEVDGDGSLGHLSAIEDGSPRDDRV